MALVTVQKQSLEIAQTGLDSFLSFELAHDVSMTWQLPHVEFQLSNKLRFREYLSLWECFEALGV